MTPTWKARCVVAAVLAAISLTGVPTFTQSVTAAGLKGAYVFNFAQFVEWTVDNVPAAAPLTLCVVNDDAVADALEQTIRGKNVDGHALVVKRFRSDAPLPTCHVLYLGNIDTKYLAGIIATLKRESILTVSDAAGFAQTGGMVELFLKDGHMRFTVNRDALFRGQIRLSSRVLALASIVRDANDP